MIADAMVFGQHENLVGVYQAASTVGSTGLERSVSSEFGALLLTAGMLPSSGPYGLHTLLGTRLGELGVPSLRFDLSGIGESLGIGHFGSSLDRASSEIRTAIDQLNERSGSEKVVLFGLCSGADDALRVALDDSRVKGLVLMDGCAYTTNRFYFHRLVDHYLSRLVSPRFWRQRWNSALSGRHEFQSMPLGNDIREYPSRDAAADQFQLLINRGVQIHFIYTGGLAASYNYASQVWEMLPNVDWKNRATTKFFGDMDHTAMLKEDQDELIEDIVCAIGRMVG